MITNCPICGTKITRKQDEADYFCPNPSCPAREVESFIHFASKQAMNIEGLGDSVMEDLYNYHYIKTIPDIYHLYKHQKELEQLEGYGKKSIENLFNSIEKSKNNSLERLLFGLGIKQVGSKMAKTLSKQYKTIDNLINTSYDELINMNDIGPIIAQNIIDYFKEEKNIKIINELKELGINTKYIDNAQEIEDENFLNKTFVLTGTLTDITRDKAKELIENKGGKVTNSVTKKTDIVIVGDNPGSKYTKAQELKIEIWDEETFLNIIQ